MRVNETSLMQANILVEEPTTHNSMCIELSFPRFKGHSLDILCKQTIHINHGYHKTSRNNDISHSLDIQSKQMIHLNRGYHKSSGNIYQSSNSSPFGIVKNSGKTKQTYKLAAFEIPFSLRYYSPNLKISEPHALLAIAWTRRQDRYLEVEKW